MKKISAAASVLALAAVTTLAFAQTSTTVTGTPSITNAPMMLAVNRDGSARLQGALQSISGSMLTVASWGGNWSIDVTAATIVRRAGGTAKLSEFKTGDSIMVWGTVSQSAAWTIVAKRVQDASLRERSTGSGTISNLNVTNQSFTLNAGDGRTLTVTMEPNSTIYLNGSQASFSNLANGMRVQVHGLVDTTQMTVSADTVRARTPRPETRNASSTNHY